MQWTRPLPVPICRYLRNPFAQVTDDQPTPEGRKIELTLVQSGRQAENLRSGDRESGTQTNSNHILSDDFDDAADINRGRIKLFIEILCYFGKVDCFVQMHLLTTQAYCYSLYGCVLWEFVYPDLSSVCTVWRVGVRSAWNMPYRDREITLFPTDIAYRTHSNLLPLISLLLPLGDEVAMRTFEFSREMSVEQQYSSESCGVSWTLECAYDLSFCS